MAPLLVYDDTRKEAECGSQACRAPITWIQLVGKDGKDGKWMPFDGSPTYVSTMRANGRLVGAVDPSVCKSHFATCPDAKKFRRTA